MFGCLALAGRVLGQFAAPVSARRPWAACPITRPCLAARPISGPGLGAIALSGSPTVARRLRAAARGKIGAAALPECAAIFPPRPIHQAVRYADILAPDCVGREPIGPRGPTDRSGGRTPERRRQSARTRARSPHIRIDPLPVGVDVVPAVDVHVHVPAVPVVTGQSPQARRYCHARSERQAGCECCADRVALRGRDIDRGIRRIRPRAIDDGRVIAGYRRPYWPGRAG